jgi:hypothetical protein
VELRLELVAVIGPNGVDPELGRPPIAVPA